MVSPLAFCLTTLNNYEGFGPLLQPQMPPAPQVAQGRTVGCGVWGFERAHGERSSGCGLYLCPFHASPGGILLPPLDALPPLILNSHLGNLCHEQRVCSSMKRKRKKKKEYPWPLHKAESDCSLPIHSNCNLCARFSCTSHPWDVK